MADYKVNFFKPATDMAKANNKLIISLIVIWAVAVFGFQFLMMGLNKPTPEKAYISFEVAWQNQNATKEEKTNLTKAIVSVLGKNIAVKDNHKELLTKALGWSLYENLSEKSLVGGKELLAPLALKKEGFDKLYSEIISFYLPLDKPAKTHAIAKSFSKADKEALPEIMKLYLVHNQNVFTDAKIFGFPFHYWYTAQFLLILFVGLCYFYAKKIDKLHEKYDFVEKD